MVMDDGFKYSFALTKASQDILSQNFKKHLDQQLLSCFCVCLFRGLADSFHGFGVPWIYLEAFGCKDSTTVATLKDFEAMNAELSTVFGLSEFTMLNVDVAMRVFSTVDSTKLATFAKKLVLLNLDVDCSGGEAYPQAVTNDLSNYQADYSTSSIGIRTNRRGAIQSANFYSGIRQALAPEGQMPLQHMPNIPSLFVFRPLLPALRNIWGLRFVYPEIAVTQFKDVVTKAMTRLWECDEHNLPYR
jgi:hypothetical protein